MKVVEEGRIALTVLCVLCFSLIAEGKPQLYSCTLKVHSLKYAWGGSRGRLMK